MKKIEEYLALFEGVKRPENHTLEIDLVDLREAAAEVARLRAENDHLRAELRALRAALAATQAGTVSVELLQITRDTCDRIREENDELRAALAATQAAESERAHEQNHPRLPEPKVAAQSGEEKAQAQQIAQETTTKARMTPRTALTAAQAGVSLSSNEGLENWQASEPAGAPTYEELHSRSPEAYAQGFAAGIEAAAQAGRGVIEKHVVFKYVLDAFNDAIRALRPAETAETEWLDAPDGDPQEKPQKVPLERPFPSASEPAGAQDDPYRRRYNPKTGRWDKPPSEPTPDDAVTYDPMGAVMTSEYPEPQAAGPSEEDVARVIREQLHTWEVNVPISRDVARAVLAHKRRIEKVALAEWLNKTVPLYNANPMGLAEALIRYLHGDDCS